MTIQYPYSRILDTVKYYISELQTELVGPWTRQTSTGMISVILLFGRVHLRILTWNRHLYEDLGCGEQRRVVILFKGATRISHGEFPSGTTVFRKNTKEDVWVWMITPILRTFLDKINLTLSPKMYRQGQKWLEVRGNIGGGRGGGGSRKAVVLPPEWFCTKIGNRVSPFWQFRRRLKAKSQGSKPSVGPTKEQGKKQTCSLALRVASCTATVVTWLLSFFPPPPPIVSPPPLSLFSLFFFA